MANFVVRPHTQEEASAIANTVASLRKVVYFDGQVFKIKGFETVRINERTDTGVIKCEGCDDIYITMLTKVRWAIDEDDNPILIPATGTLNKDLIELAAKSATWDTVKKFIEKLKGKSFIISRKPYWAMGVNGKYAAQTFDVSLK